MKDYVCKIDVFHKEMKFCLFQVHQKVEPKLRVSQKNGSTEMQREETQEDCDLVLTRPGVTEASLALGGQEAGRPGFGQP